MEISARSIDGTVLPSEVEAAAIEQGKKLTEELLSTTDGSVWAKRFVETVIAAGFPVSNLWDESFITGWFASAIETAKSHQREFASENINSIVGYIHRANVEAGWWTDLATGEPLKRNVGELLMLMVSELAEAMEGHRKNLMDDKLPHRPMIEVELADTLIRIFDAAGGLGLDLGGAVVEKLAYNAKREDHKIENRAKADGKKY